MDEKLKNQSIDRLDISNNAINSLKTNNINTLEMLCKSSKTNLKSINITQNEIKKIEIELQLLGLSLKS